MKRRFALLHPLLGLALLPLAGAAAGAAADTPPPAAGVSELKDTIVTSDHLELRNDGELAYFAFSGNVRLTGTNLEVTCDKLEIYAESKKGEDGSLGSVGGLRRIVATGHVVIAQEGRRATAGRAEVLPDEDKIVLTEDPVVTDPQGTVSGERMTFYRGRQNGEIVKPRVLLRALPDLGFPRRPATDGPATDSTDGVDAPAPESASSNGAAEDNPQP